MPYNTHTNRPLSQTQTIESSDLASNIPNPPPDNA